jgi:putative MATE family efflux protein
MKPDYTTGSVTKAILTLSIPIVLANALQSGYQIVDAFWVGRLGADAVAAVSLSFPIFFLLLSIGAGVSIGGNVLIAQAVGRKNVRDAEHYATQSLILMFALSILLGVIGYLISPWAIGYLGASAEVYPLAVQFLQISFIGLPFLFGYFAYMSTTRAVGEVKIPLYIVLGTVILNLLLDPLFIYGWGPIHGYGVAGAAVASVCTQAIAMLIGFVLLWRGTHGIRMHVKDMKPEPNTYKRIFGIGFPASIDQSARALSLLIMAGIVAALGTAVIAAYGIGMRIYSFIIIPAIGFSVATSTLVGQNIGAGKPDRAEAIVRKSTAIVFWTLTAIGALVFIFAYPLSIFFINGEPEVVTMSVAFLRTIALSFGLLGVQFTITGGFRGTGHTVKALVISLISLFIIQIPLAYILGHYTNLHEEGIWIAFLAANIVGALIAWLWFARGTWKIPSAHFHKP